MYYKFSRSKGVYQIPIREDQDSDISTYFNGDIIFSEQDEISEGESKYVINMDDGLLYESYDRRMRRSNFDKAEAADTTVINLTKVGLDVYDKKNGKNIYHADVDEHLMMILSFSEDAKGNIWVPVSYRSEKGWKDGFIIYKNYTNSFANVSITNFRYTTVLTDGDIDHDKIEELKETPIVKKRRMMMARAASKSTSKTSGKSTTTNNSKKKTKSTNVVNKDAKITTEEKKEISYAKKVAKNSPSILQNKYGYPAVKKVKDANGETQYSYDYSTKPLTNSDVRDIYSEQDRDVRNIKDNFDYKINYYNRFKKALPEDILTRGFMHVFITRPDLNLITSNGNSLRSQISKDSFFQYKWKQKPDLVRQLVKSSGTDDNFMLFLSNKVESFTNQDESIKYADYGKTFQNHSIMLGKGIFDSLIAGTFEIKYTDTRDLDVLSLHKMWIQYISNVYHGSWDPKTSYIWKKIIDYAVSLQVIVTAEDFETIIYWSKYYGVFPINVPYSALSWDSGNLIIKPDFTITYGYSWREEWNPAELTELNMNCFKNRAINSAQYIPTFNSNYGRAGTTWVGAPFVETIVDMDKKGGQYGSGVSLKLRFKPGPNLY